MVQGVDARKIASELKPAVPMIPFVRSWMASACADDMIIFAHDTVLFALESLSNDYYEDNILENVDIAFLISKRFSIDRTEESIELNGYLYALKIKFELDKFYDDGAKNGLYWRMKRLKFETPDDIFLASNVPFDDLRSYSSKNPSRMVAAANAWAWAVHYTFQEEIDRRAFEKKLSHHNGSIREYKVRISSEIITVRGVSRLKCYCSRNYDDTLRMFVDTPVRDQLRALRIT